MKGGGGPEGAEGGREAYDERRATREGQDEGDASDGRVFGLVPV